MGQWHSKELGDGTQALAPSQQIMEAFIPTFQALGQPFDMAVFSRNDLERNVVTAYFSPAASALAKAFGATVCDKPNRDGLGLLVGDQRSIQLLFPNA